MLDSHFNTTLQIMIALECDDTQEQNSESIAKKLDTNPAFIRKIMAKLSKAELIETRRGKSGGASLARAPKNISLRDIYTAINEHKKNSGAYCQSCSIQSALMKLSSHLEKAHLLILGRIKLSHLTKDIKS